MDEDECRRLLNMLASVEKEEIEAERAVEEDRQLIRRQLFANNSDIVNDEDQIIDREGSDQSEDEIEHLDHETSSETSLEDLSEREEDHTEENQHFILGRDLETRWNAHMNIGNLRGRVRRHNIIRAERIGVRLPCPKGDVTTAKSPLESWKLFFPDNLIRNIVNYTNVWIDKNKTNYSRERDAKETNQDEIHAVLSLLYLAGMLRASHTSLEDLWSADGLGVEYFRATMLLRRFKFLLRALRFDDIRTRRQRKARDKLAPIREVFYEFVERCKRYYSLSEYVTVDEMLEGFRGRCSFRQYIPNKPARYGLKMYALCDARTFYTGNLEIYCGKQLEGPYRHNNNATDVAVRLIAPVSGTGRQVTLDNWYGSIPLAKELLENHSLTVTCTLKKNKREIPPSFIEKNIRRPCTSLFAYQNDMTLLSYVPKKNKVVQLLFTFHHTDAIDEDTGDKYKPIMLTCYNKYKGGVDTVDQMKGAYSVARKSNRWSLTLFFLFLNIAGINSYVILRSNAEEEVSNRRNFIRSLGMALCRPQMVNRSSITSLPVALRQRVREISGQPAPAPVNRPAEDDQPTTGRCYLCSRQKNRKSRTRCPICHFFTCREHTRFTCQQCAGDNVDSDTDDDE